MTTKTKVIIFSSVGLVGLGFLSYYIYKKLKYDVVKEGTFTIEVQKEVKPENVEVVPEDTIPTTTDSIPLTSSSLNSDTWGDYIAYEDLSLGDYEIEEKVEDSEYFAYI